MESSTRVLIADGRERVRFGLRTLLDNLSEVQVVGEVGEAGHLLEKVQETCAELVLVDWGLPGLRDESSLEALHAACPRVRLIVLSGQPEARKAAMQAGADAFVNKTESPVYLLSVIQDCCSRETYEIDEQEV